MENNDKCVILSKKEYEELIDKSKNNTIDVHLTNNLIRHYYEPESIEYSARVYINLNIEELLKGKLLLKCRNIIQSLECKLRKEMNNYI